MYAFVQISRREADHRQYLQYKIVLFGVSKVWKTSIVDYFVYNRFEECSYHRNTVSFILDSTIIMRIDYKV